MKAYRVACALALAAAVASLTGCVTVNNTYYPIAVSGAGYSAPASASADAAATTAETTGTGEVVEAESETASATAVEARKTTGAVKLSALPKDLVQYAKDLGAKPVKGAKVFLLVIGSAKDQKAAQVIVDKTFDIDSDYEGYFVIEKSDHFKGLTASPFVAIEAFKTQAKADKALAANKPTFASAAIVPVTVLCADPLPVYEDLAMQ